MRDSGGNLQGQGMPDSKCRPERPVGLLAATRHLPVPPIKLLSSHKEVEKVDVLESGRVDCPSWSTDGLFCGYSQTRSIKKRWNTYGANEVTRTENNTDSNSITGRAESCPPFHDSGSRRSMEPTLLTVLATSGSSGRASG